MAEDVTTAELARSLREYRQDTSTALHGLRNDMAMQTGKLELHMNELATQMSKGYVSVQFFEEVRRNQGERIGSMENRLTKIEEKSSARFDTLLAKVENNAKSTDEKFEEKDKESKADRRLIFTSLGAPFIMLIIGILLALATGGQ